MYFPNAFKKSYIGAVVLAGSPAVNTLSLASSGTTANLTAGQIGVYNPKTFAVITSAPSAGTIQPFLLVQGSYYTVDKISPTLGGYQESVKSKSINPKYVSKFFTVAAETAQNQIISVGWDQSLTGGTASTGFVFYCGKTYNLRIDLKGSPALRFLSHNIYHTFDAYTGCCANGCDQPCTGAPVDAATVLLKWADQINADPIVSNFIQAAVYVQTTGGSPVAPTGKTLVTTAGYTPNTATPLSVIASLQLTVAYTDTVFGNCSFTYTDKYELEPLFIFTSVTDETGDPCATKNFGNSSQPSGTTAGTFNGVKELQIPRQANGVGDTVLREYILFQRYLQNSFPDGSSVDSIRLREVLHDTALSTITRGALYDKVCLLHNIPRLYNSTGIFDNDQYLIVINVPTGTVTTNLTSLISGILTSAGNTVPLEAY